MTSAIDEKPAPATNESASSRHASLDIPIPDEKGVAGEKSSNEMERSTQATLAVDGPESSRPTSMNIPDEKKDMGDNSSVEAENSGQIALSDDQYPHGFRLWLLAGASIVAVFLIALDQVSLLMKVSPKTQLKMLTTCKDHRWNGHSQDN